MIRPFWLALSLSLLSPPAFTQSALDSCPLTDTESKNLLSNIQTSAAGCEATQTIPDDLAAISAKLAEPTQAELRAFAQSVWLNSMRNLVLTRLDTELRYKKTKSDPAPTANVEQIVNEICAQSSTEPGNGQDRCRYAKIPNARAELVKAAKEYVAAFKATKQPVLSWAEAKADLNARKRRIDDAYAPIKEMTTPGKQIRVGTFASDATSNLRPDLAVKTPVAVPLEDYHTARAIEMGAGAGVLLHAPALEDHSGPDDPAITSDALVGKAIAEIKSATRFAAGELNTDVAWTVGIDPKDNKSVAPAWLQRMMVASPTAVGQTLAAHPEYASLVCNQLQRIESVRELNRKLELTMHGMMWVTVFAGGVTLVPDLLLLHVSTRTAARLATVGALRNTMGMTAFTGLTGTHVSQRVVLSNEAESLRQNLLAGTGVTEADVAFKEGQLDQNTQDLALDVAFLVVPAATKLRPVSQVLKGMPAAKTVESITKSLGSEPRQIQAAFQAFSLACGVLDVRCAVVMSAFHGKPRSEQLKILASKESMAKFIRESSKQSETTTPIEIAPAIKITPPLENKISPAVETTEIYADTDFAHRITGSEATPVNRYARTMEKKGFTVMHSAEWLKRNNAKALFGVTTVIPKEQFPRAAELQPVVNISKKAALTGKLTSSEAHEGTHGQTFRFESQYKDTPRTIKMTAKNGEKLSANATGYSKFQSFDEIKTHSQDLARIMRGMPEAEVQAHFERGLKEDPNFKLQRGVILARPDAPGTGFVTRHVATYREKMQLVRQTKELMSEQVKDLSEVLSNPQEVKSAFDWVKDITIGENTYLYAKKMHKSGKFTYEIPLSQKDFKNYQELVQLMTDPKILNQPAEIYRRQLQKASEAFVQGLKERTEEGYNQAALLEKTYRQYEGTFTEMIDKPEWTLEEYTLFRRAVTAPARTVNEFDVNLRPELKPAGPNAPSAPRPVFSRPPANP